MKNIMLSKVLLNLVAIIGLINADTAMAEEAVHSSHMHQHKKKSPTISETMINSMHKPMMDTTFAESDNIDLNYLSNMIPHHQGAIDASEILLKYTQNENIKNIAKRIIQSQGQEIETFKTILKTIK